MDWFDSMESARCSVDSEREHWCQKFQKFEGRREKQMFYLRDVLQLKKTGVRKEHQNRYLAG